MEFVTNDANYEGLTIPEVAKIKKLKPLTLRSRVRRNPNTPIELLVYPVPPNLAHDRETEYTVGDVTMTISDWAISVGLSKTGMRRRFEQYEPEEAVNLNKGEHRRLQTSKGVPEKARNYDNWDEDLELKRRVKRYKKLNLTVDEMVAREKLTANFGAYAA